MPTRCVMAMVTALCLVWISTSGQVLAQGNSGGNGGKGKPAEDTPVIIVFRDGPDDLLTSDGDGAYIHGEVGIESAVLLNDGGNVQLRFTQYKGKKTGPSRRLSINLTAEPDIDLGGVPPDLSDPVDVTVRVMADQGDGFDLEGGVRDGVTHVGTARHAYARLPIFGPRDSALEGWKLSYSDSRLRSGVNGVGFARVDCVRDDGSRCTAWLVHKEVGALLQPTGVEDDENRAALVGGGTQELPDAGEYILPFAFHVCLRDEVSELVCAGLVFP